MFKKRFISILALLCLTVSGAWAQEVTLLTTIESTGDNASFKSGSKTFDNIATVTFSGDVSNDDDNWGWYSEPERTLTVTAAEGYTITRVKFYTDSSSAFDEEYPFEAILVDYIAKVNGNLIGQFGVTKIEVYGYADTPAPATVAVTGVTLAPTSATLTLGETETVTLIPTVLPAEATDKSVTWSSSDEAVATVTDGVVTAVAAGTATITVTTTDGAKTATCAVTVAAPAASTYTVTLKEGTDDATSWQGKAGTGVYQALPLEGVEAGKAVSVKYNGTKKVKSVKAKKAAPANVPVTSITLNKTATEITVGQTETLSVTEVLPANATDPTYTWKTSDETKATVDQDGKVTAVAAGNVNIYAEANDGSGVSATCAVTVTLTYPIALSAVTADYIGSVITSDGNVYPAKTAVPDGCTAVGILGKVTETGHGLILALKNATSQTWNTINGWTSETAYAGTTLKVLPDDGARGVNLTSYTTLGATAVSNWAVAQKSDYEAIFINLGSKAGDEDGTTYDGNVNAFITTGVGGTALSDYYWSATENGDYAWNFGSVYWNDNNKTDSYRVRPVLGF